jgi:pimeloyl-ACP methyl ester carboxylesterase
LDCVYAIKGATVTTSIQLRDATVVVEDSGEGLPVLLLHGFPATRMLWSKVAPVLVEAGFRVLIPDLVGYGDSDAPVGVRVDMASQARWMFELLDKLGVTSAAVVAHDVSGVCW